MEPLHPDPRSQARSHGDKVLGETVQRYGPEAAQLGVQVQHPLIALPHFTEHSFRTWNIVKKKKNPTKVIYQPGVCVNKCINLFI